MIMIFFKQSELSALILIFFRSDNFLAEVFLDERLYWESCFLVSMMVYFNLFCLLHHS